MWIILFTLALVATIFTIIKALNNYLDHDIITNINVYKEKPAEFPAITFFFLKNSKYNISLNSNILRRCTFNSLVCGPNDFHKLHDRNGFISYRFKQNISYSPGSFFGFQVELNLETIPNDLEDHEHRIGLSGLRIIVHNVSNDPVNYAGMPLNGFEVAPGFINEIPIKRVFTYRLGPPFNNCLKDVKSLDSFDSDLYRHVIKYTNYSYRQDDCFDYCIGRTMLRRENITHRIDHWANILGSNRSLIHDFLYIIQNKEHQMCQDECPEECDSVRYELTHSFTKLAYNASEENMVFFNIFYANLEYTVIDQIPKMDGFDFISNIGGNLGLFIGISFLSLIELVEFLIEIICIFFKRKITFSKKEDWIFCETLLHNLNSYSCLVHIFII